MINKRAQFHDGLAFARTLTIRKIINSFLLRASYSVSKLFNFYIHWGHPESVSIEPTNICNLSCPECPTGNKTLTRTKLYLSREVFNDTINQLSDYLVHLQLFFQGEPFLHPDIYELFTTACNKGIYTSTSTNGHYLTPKNCTKIVKSGLHRIIISVDGTTQDVYEKYRVGGSLDTVLSGISNLIEAKRELKSTTPYIIMQFVVFNTNEHQIDDIKKLAKSINIDKLEIKSAQIDDFKNGNILMPISQRYSRYIHNDDSSYSLNRNEQFKCKRVWNSFVISADNKLIPCCFDKDGRYGFGLLNNNINKDWQGDKLKKFRQQVWNDNSKFKICQNCTEGLR